MEWKLGVIFLQSLCLNKTINSLVLKSNLKLFFQFFSKRAQLFQALTQVHMAVELNKGFDEVRNTPLGFHLIPAEMKEKLPWILSSKWLKPLKGGFGLQKYYVWTPREDSAPEWLSNVTPSGRGSNQQPVLLYWEQISCWLVEIW